MKSRFKAHRSRLDPKSIDYMVEEIRLTFDANEHKGIVQWSTRFDEFLRNGQFTECEYLVALARSLSGRVCGRCKVWFQFAEGKFRERRNQPEDLIKAERLYLQSSKRFQVLLGKARTDRKSVV